MRAHEREHASEFLDCWFSEGTRGRIRQIVESLSRKGAR
jgi:hypothetical protein